MKLYLFAITVFTTPGWLLTVADSPGFDLFFTSNLEEMVDVPIQFENPLPSWLKGILIRNGLGRFEIGARKFYHSFDAFGKLCSWRFWGNGSVTFSTKFLQSDSYKASMRSHTIVPYLLFEGVDPPFNEIEKITALIRGIDNMNVNVYRFYDAHHHQYQYVALNDYWKVYNFDPKSLSTVKSINAEVPDGTPDSSLAFLSFLSSAHPLPEMGTTNHFTFVSSVSLVPGFKSKIELIRIKSAMERELIAKWSVDKVPYMHSFSITENYAIFFASPFYVNVLKMSRYAEPFNCLDWYEDEETTIYVVELKNGIVHSIKTDNVFTMHHINAFEEDEDIVVDISTYPSPDFIKNLQLSILRDPQLRNSFDVHAVVKRYHINLKNKTAMFTLFDSTPDIPFASRIDMPTINENYRYKNYCFVYGVVLKKDDMELSRIALVKKDLCNMKRDKQWYVPGHYPVEAWFVQAPGAKEEDDGYLLVPVLDGERSQSYLTMISAKDMKTVNIASLPTIIPFGLHGKFFEDV
nr:BCO1 protein [Sinohyriopsis cumingii]